MQPAPESKTEVPREAEENQGLRALLFSALEDRWRSYSKQLTKCRSEFSSEAVHDLRVAARRMIAVIQLLETIVPRPRLKKMRRVLKRQLDEFDELRDTQVTLAELSQNVQEMPQLEEFQKVLQGREEKLLQSLHRVIGNFETSKLAKGVEKTGETIEIYVNEETRVQVMQAVDNAFLRTRKRLDWVNRTRPETIHRVRVAFKSFRYMVEILRPLLQDFPNELSKQMNSYQTWMGEVQDSAVFLQTLAAFSEQSPIPDLETVRRYFERRQAKAISTFTRRQNQLFRFWRAAPDQPFPWVKRPIR